MDRDSDRPRLTERDFDNMSRMELWQAYQKLERYLFSKKIYILHQISSYAIDVCIDRFFTEFYLES